MTGLEMCCPISLNLTLGQPSSVFNDALQNEKNIFIYYYRYTVRENPENVNQ